MSAANTTASSKTGLRIEIKVALAFPDIYDLGMSNLGIMNLYNQVNLASRICWRSASSRPGWTWKR